VSLSVVLDVNAPNDGAFAHALEWASRLHVPLQGALFPSTKPPATLLDACGQACARQRVAWTADVWDEPPALSVPSYLTGEGLRVFGQALPAPLRTELLYWSLRMPRTAALIAPPTWQPMKRVLILHHAGASDAFLAAAARVCREFECDPVVLTLARSEGAARCRQAMAEVALQAEGVGGHFDFVVGCEVGAAVALAANSRRCSHVFVEKQHTSAWGRWLRGSILERLFGLADSLSLLALPGTTPAKGSS
jgi:hypothetical protein